MSDRFIGEMLVRRGCLSPDRLGEMEALQQEKGGRLVEHLLASKAVDEPTLLQNLAAELDVSFHRSPWTAECESLQKNNIPMLNRYTSDRRIALLYGVLNVVALLSALVIGLVHMIRPHPRVE